jgi:hypothetical protein
MRCLFINNYLNRINTVKSKNWLVIDTNDTLKTHNSKFFKYKEKIIRWKYDLQLNI